MSLNTAATDLHWRQQKSNFTFNVHLNALSSKPKTNHQNKLAKMNNQTKLLLLIYTKKYLQKRNSSRKFKLILRRINLLRVLTRTIMDNSVLLLSPSQETQRLRNTSSRVLTKCGGIVITIFIANSGKRNFECLYQLLNI